MSVATNEMRALFAAQREAGEELLQCDECNELSPATLDVCPFCEGQVPDPVEKPTRTSPANARARLAALGIHPGKVEIITGPDLDRVTHAAVAVLERDESLYQRDGRIVTVLRATEDERPRRAAIAPGSPVIREVSNATLKVSLASVATFVRRDAEGKVHEVGPPPDVVAAVLAKGEWRSVRPLLGMIEAPSIRPDGSVIDQAGYDPLTGYLYIPSTEFPPVPEAPTRDDAVHALAELAEVFCDFRYAGETDEQRAAHRAVPIAALLSIIARPAIGGSTPAFLFDAPTPGSGKSLQVAAFATIATGRAASLMNWPSDEAELEKVLAAFALLGAPIVAFDNLTRPFAGAPLDRCLTASDCVQLRVLGKSEVPSLPWRAVVVATGNNLEVHGDTCRRVLLARVDPECERPDERENFRHPDLVAWCLAERPRLVVAALTLLRAFVVAGRPPQPIKPFGSFESWAALVPSALMFAGAGDPTLVRQELAAKGDPMRLAMGALLEGWTQLDPDGASLSAKEALERLYEKPERGDGSYGSFVASVDDRLAPLREAVETLCPSRSPDGQPTPHQLGVVLRRHRDRVVGGRVLRAQTDRNGVARWRVTETSPSSPATPSPSPKVRGMRGIAGDVSTFARESLDSDHGGNRGNGLEHPPQIPASPAPPPKRSTASPKVLS